MMMLVSIRYLLIHTIDSKNDAIGPISCIDGDPNDTLFELMGPIKDETPSMFEDVDADDFRLWKLNGVPRRSRAQKTLKKIEHIDFSEITNYCSFGYHPLHLVRRAHFQVHCQSFSTATSGIRR